MPEDDGFVEIGGVVTWINPSGDKIADGQTWQGVYEKTEVSKNYAPNLVHFVRQDDGGMLGFNGQGKLDYLIKNIKAGSYIRVTYTGKEKKTDGTKFKGGKDWCHGFKVAVRPGGAPVKLPDFVEQPQPSEDAF